MADGPKPGRPPSSSREQERMISEVKRNNIQPSSRTSETDRKPIQSVPSLKDRRDKVELEGRKQPVNNTSRPVVKDEQRLSKSAAFREERPVNNQSSRPVMKDERRMSNQPQRPKEEQSPASREPQKSLKPASSLTSKPNKPLQSSSGTKPSQNVMKKVEGKSVPPAAGDMLRERLSSCSNQSLPQKSQSSQMVKKDPKMRPPDKSKNIAPSTETSLPKGVPSRLSGATPAKEKVKSVPLEKRPETSAVNKKPQLNERPSMVERKPSAVAERGPSGDRRPPLMAERRPLSMGERRPPGMGDRRPPGMGDRRPPGMGDRRPPGMGDRRPPGMGDRRLLAARGRPMHPQDARRRPPAKRRIESDDEYDSELDDFIDDGPEEGEDYSKYIKEIFGYDKSRYRGRDFEEDDEDECMESSFAQQMKEEFVSTKLDIPPGKQVSGRMKYEENTSSSAAEMSDWKDLRKRPLEDGEELCAESCAKRQRGYQEPSCESVGEADETDKYKELHKAIEDGDFQLVKCLIQNDTEEKQFIYKEISALYKAYSCHQYEIVAYLIRNYAELLDSDEDVCDLGVDMCLVNSFLEKCNKKTEKSCIYRLISQSKSPQDLDRDRLNVIKSLYKDLFKSEIIKLLMKVLETESFDIVYDFESETVDCIYSLNERGGKVYGLTLSKSKEIFIGAKNMLSDNSRKRAKVYGVVAEELCHLALTTLFENYAKPYRAEDLKLMQEYRDILKAVECFANRSCHIETVINNVFVDYQYYSWESELIARIPHVIGIHGEEFGRQIFQESPELCRLFSFYKQNILLKCKEHTDPSLNTKSHRIIGQLRKNLDCISFEEKKIQPLKEKFPSFRKYLVNEEGIYVISTNCTKLCTLHIYHELKKEYRDLVEKKCVFFSSKCFEMKHEEILDALKDDVWKHLILVVDRKEISLRTLTCEFLDKFECLKYQKLEIIIITSSQSLGQKFKSKIMYYSWNDLSHEYKNLRTNRMEYIFRDKSEHIYVKMDNVPKLFSEGDVIKIMSGELLEVVCGTVGDCQGYNSETYIERKFKAMTVDQSFFGCLPPDTSIFIYGLHQWKELAINETQVQYLWRATDEIREGKCIFLSDSKRDVTFEDFLRKTPSKSNICLYYYKKVFYQWKLHYKGNDFEEHKRQIEITEEGMIGLLNCIKVLIISERAGIGKSTVTYSLIKKVHRDICDSWPFRVNLKDFSINCFLDNGDEAFCRLLGLNNCAEKYHFSECCRKGCCYVFFDGYDEIPLKYRTKALNLISNISKRKGVKVVVTTRMNLVEELEEKLNCLSLQMVPFSRENQLSYLEKLWKWNLKFPNAEDKEAILQKIQNITKCRNSDSNYLNCRLENINVENGLNSLRSEIDNLDLTKSALDVLNEISLDKKGSVFMGIPLNLYMMGIIYLNSNSTLKFRSNIYFLYCTFIEQKYEIYLKEKLQLRRNGSHVMDYIVEDVKKKTFGIHFKLANQFMRNGKIGLEMNDVEKELCTGLGILFYENGKMQILHQTFAEFFFAESFRKSMDKQNCEEILFKSKYNSVRKFLSNALKEKDFEIPRVNFFKDVDFFVSLMERVIDNEISGKQKSPLDRLNVSKIVRKLLEMFEANDGKKELIDRFIERLNASIMDRVGKMHGNLIYPMRFGSCLTIEMIKNLVNRNFMVNSIIVLNFVKSSENLEKVTNIVRECISMKRECVLGVMKSEGSDTLHNNRVVLGAMEWFPKLTELLRIEDSNGKGLLFHALWNGSAEIFADLLKFPREVLGKEQFQKVIIESNEYRKQMKDFIKKISFGKMYTTFKALYSVFGAEMEILFEKELKIHVLHKSVIKSTLNNPFGNVLRSFIEFFGIQQTKELLLSKDFNGKYLIQILFNGGAIKTLKKNLEVIEKFLEDRSKMKQFLKSKSTDLRNMFHFSVLKDKNVKIILEWCGRWLERDEVKEMILCVDKFGKNVINLAECRKSNKRSTENLNTLKEFVHEDD